MSEDRAPIIPGQRVETNSADPLDRLRAVLETDPEALSPAERAIRKTVTGGRAFKELRLLAINDLIAQGLSDTEIKLALLTDPLLIPLLDHKSTSKANEMLQEEIRQMRRKRDHQGHQAKLDDYARILKRALAESMRALRNQAGGAHFKSLLDSVLALAKDIAIMEGALQQRGNQSARPASRGTTTKPGSNSALKGPTPGAETGLAELKVDPKTLSQEYEPDDEDEDDFDD